MESFAALLSGSHTQLQWFPVFCSWFAKCSWIPDNHHITYPLSLLVLGKDDYQSFQCKHSAWVTFWQPEGAVTNLKPLRMSCNSATHSRTYRKSLFHLFFVCPMLILETAAVPSECVAVTTISPLPLLCTSCCHVWVLTRGWNKRSRSRCVEHRCRVEPVCRCACVSVNTMFWSCRSRH